ncbi:hypothetical protein E2C01_092447 [Portunus trituberculatus]|uniref:Uncharacterized protein n=1 Tax=Portunus trituberculatus TaxID=210409 RepID=A0A5B7JLZ8_PORTR|nr:hypothetical protein [Portunus trituberculatus]
MCTTSPATCCCSAPQRRPARVTQEQTPLVPPPPLPVYFATHMASRHHLPARKRVANIPPLLTDMTTLSSNPLLFHHFAVLCMCASIFPAYAPTPIWERRGSNKGVSSSFLRIPSSVQAVKVQQPQHDLSTTVSYTRP